jgi:serine/threonine-protein kinase ULK/ATG1
METIVLKEQYTVIKEIGSGAFGKVYMVEDRKTKNKYAVKRILKKSLDENEYLHQAFWKELEVMRICECENSVRLVEHFFSSNYYNIVMELCDTDLEIVLNKRGKGFSEEEVRILMKQLNNVFQIMNKENIIHRDLKLRNIMVVMAKEGGINPYYPLQFCSKLSDFGFSKVMEDDITRTKLGTPATMAPEIMMGKNYTNKADLWSIGIITYQLLFKTLPFRARSEQELLNNILNNKGIKIPEGYKISDTLLDLLKSLLQIDPNVRISWKNYFDHPFFKEVVNNSIMSLEKVRNCFTFLILVRGEIYSSKKTVRRVHRIQNHKS